MTGFLASVRDMHEALVAAAAPVDVLDLKAPDRGALGALEVDAVAAIVRRLRGSRAISATIGDLPLDPSRVAAAARAMAGTGVDYVKIGFFPGGDLPGTLAALEPLARSGVRLVAVLFGDHDPSPAPAERLAAAGFAGCMLDTADKTRGALTELCTPDQLARFVAEVRRNRLLCGLAGSLRASDIPGLLSLQPDYLGFRGALCRDHRRVQSLDRELLQRIATAVRGAQAHPAAQSPAMIPASPATTLETWNP
jgi:uncharacterized protein (UPF0264 family)